MRTKILLLSAMFFCITQTLSAQVNKGRYLIGGGFNVYSAKNAQGSPASRYSSLNANIQFGKVVKDNTVAGVLLLYGNSKSTYVNSPQNKSSRYSGGIFYKRYKTLLKNIYAFGEVDAVYFHSDMQDYFQASSGFSKAISDGASIFFIPGISYALCKRMQVELLMPNILSLSYSHVKTDYNYANSTPPTASSVKGSTFSVETNLNTNLLSSFGIGFKFFLGK